MCMILLYINAKEWIKNTMGDESHPTPTQRGFDEFYGTLGGGGSYYQPPSLVRNDQVIEDTMPEGFYYTDAINDEACRMIEGACNDGDDPFFLYVAHVAPHWPLHAPQGKNVSSIQINEHPESVILCINNMRWPILFRAD